MGLFGSPPPNQYSALDLAYDKLEKAIGNLKQRDKTAKEFTALKYGASAIASANDNLYTAQQTYKDAAKTFQNALAGQPQSVVENFTNKLAPIDKGLSDALAANKTMFRLLAENQAAKEPPQINYWLNDDGTYTRTQNGVTTGNVKEIPRGGINYALKPNAVGETKAVGGTTSVIPSTSGSTYFVSSSQNGPQISVANKDQYEKTLQTANNITPIVNYNTAQSAIANSPIINAGLANQAKQVQEIIANSLVKGIYAGVASQTDRPEYTIDNKIGDDLRVYQNDITPIAPLTPITQENIDKKISEKIERDENISDRVQKAQEEQDSLAFEFQKKQGAEELEAQKKQAQSQLDIQAQKNAEIEAKRLADAKAAEASRLRASQQFEYDSAIEAALRAAEGNSALARRQFSAYEDRQKTMDAEKLAQQRAKRGNPAGYAGGFAQKAIQPTPATPAAIKAPAMKSPQLPAPIVPPANEITSSFLPPKVDGLQFGGT